jgi:hypothetical protein
MRAAPAFSLPCGIGSAERCVLAAIGGLCAAAVAGALWSHVDAAAGFAGLGRGYWIAVVAVAGVAGGGAGWLIAAQTVGAVHWQQGQWTFSRREEVRSEKGSLEAVFDLGGWMLLRFRPLGGVRTHWLCVRRQCAGGAWHALRATLFAPGIAATDGSSDGARS